MKRHLSDWIEGFLEYMDGTEPPVLYREWGAISTIAGALQRKCWGDWMRFTWYPNMYIILVGPSGIGKNQVIDEVERFLSNLSIPLAPTSGSRQGITQTLVESNKIEVSADGSVIPQHSSLTILCQEFVTFIGYNDDDFITVLTDWYDCGGISGDWSYRTIGRGEEKAASIFVNIIGGAVPTTLREALPSTALNEGGFAGRTIFVYASQKATVQPWPVITKAQENLKKLLIEDLQSIYQLHGRFTVTEDFRNRYIDWYVDTYDRRPPFTSEVMAPYMARRRLHLSKLCMIVSASCRDDMVIDLPEIERAIDILERTEILMPRTFHGYGRGKDQRVLASIMDYIADHTPTSDRDVMTEFYPHLNGYVQLDDILKRLTVMGFCKITYENGTARTITYQTTYKDHGRFGTKYRT